MSHADISSRDAHILFKVGKTHEGYFTNTEILAQANHAMDIIDRNYPCEDHIFFMTMPKCTQHTGQMLLLCEICLSTHQKISPKISYVQLRTQMAALTKFACKMAIFWMECSNHFIFLMVTSRLACSKACAK